MQRLTESEWENVIRNTRDMDEEIEVTWLDNCPGPSEWALTSGESCELFEDSFETEQDAYARLEYVENRYDENLKLNGGMRNERTSKSRGTHGHSRKRRRKV